MPTHSNPPSLEPAPSRIGGVETAMLQPNPLSAMVGEAISTAGDGNTTGPIQPKSRRSILAWIGSSAEWVFGALSLVVILAVLATIPILQLLSLGYLLEVSRRVATGRLQDGLFGVRKAGRVGSALLGTWLIILPLRLLSSLTADAELIDPGGVVAGRLRIWLIVLTVIAVVHIAWAWYRGGRFRHFLWPAPRRLWRRLRRGGMLVDARDRLWDFAVDLNLPYYFGLGLRGMLGAVVWLVLPISLLVMATRLDGAAAALIGLTGGVLFAGVLLYLPFLQVHFAMQNRLAAMFEIGHVRRQIARAPIAIWFALLITLLFAVPLYLLKIEVTPREVVWLPSLVFIVFAFPARLLCGWAFGRASRRQESRHFAIRWAARLAALPVVAIYALIVYFTQYVSWYGAWSLYEQHAFLVPVPFLAM